MPPACTSCDPPTHRNIDVTVPRKATPRPGIALHRARLDPVDVTSLSGIPVTTMARTLVDLAGTIPSAQLAKALTEAELRRVDVHDIEDALRRTRTRNGAGHATLTAVLAEHRKRGLQLTRSVLEERFAALVADHGLPVPALNARIEGFEVDAVWHAQRLAVELDGYAHHHDQDTFQRDRTKANALALSGWIVLRFTHDDVTRRPRTVADSLARCLAA